MPDTLNRIPTTPATQSTHDSTGISVLFLNPPSIPYTYLVNGLSDPHLDIHQNVAMPMGLLYLSAMLENRLPGIRVALLDLARSLCDYSKDRQRKSMTIEELTIRQLETLPDDFEPTFVGISILFSTAHKSSLHIASAVKERWPHVPVVMGGMHATNAVETLLESPAVDYVCRGEGEAIIAELATLLSQGNEVEVLPGIVGRKKLAADRQTALHQSAPVIDDLDQIPFPAWHLLPMEEYIVCDDSRSRRLDGAYQEPRTATIITTRGCPFHCTFCASWTVHGRAMRYRSTSNVLEELALLKNTFGVNTFTPEDDLFSVKKDRLITLCNAVAEKFNRSIQFQFPNGLSVATLDRDVIRAMINMGMRVANVAIESGSKYVQRHIIRKNCNLERAREVVRICRDEGILVRAYFIIGFPGETQEMIQETIDFIRSLPSDWNVINIAAPLIGTEMYHQMLNAGWIDTTFNWDAAFFQERTFDTPDVSARELKEIVYDINIKTNFFENYNCRMGNYDRAISFFSDVLRSHKGHLIAQYCMGRCYKGKGEMAACEQSIKSCRTMLAAGYPMAEQQLAHYGEFMPELSGMSTTEGCGV
jgi:radical SAM superfamily enzyme YgiQ (UPF0313 family)